MRTRFLLSTFSLLLVVASFATTSLAQTSNGWGKGGNPKPSPTPSPVPTPPPVAGDPDWTGGTSTDWSNTGNWSPAATPGPADVARFSGTFTAGRQPNLTASASAGGLWMTGTLGQNVTISASGAAILTLNGTTINSIAGLGILVDNTDARTLTISAPVTLGNAQTWRNNSGNAVSITNTATGLNTNAKALTIDGTGDWNISAKITSTGAITLAGTNTVTFSSTASTYTGDLTVQSGTLKIDTANDQGANGELGHNNQVTLGGSGTTGTLEYTGANVDSSHTFALATSGTGVFQVDTAATVLTLSGVISGGGGLTKTGPGTLKLNAANTYSGDTTINAGVLLLADAAAIPSGAGKGNVVIGSSGTLSTGDFDAFSINGLSGSGLLQKTDAPGVAGNGDHDTMTLGNNDANGSFSGTITDGGSGHPLNIVKTGAGTQTFSGANTYAGTTAVNAGTLFANNTAGSATGTGAVSVTNAGSVLGGTGFIGGTVTVNNGAILEGGTGSTGQTLTLSNNLTLNPGSIIELALGPGLTHSTLARTAGTWSFSAAQKFTFILNPGTTTGFYNNIITGLAAAPNTSPSTWTITNSGFVGTFSYDGLGDIDLNVTAVPEPATYFAAALALLALIYFQRQRLAQTFKRRAVSAAN